MSSPETWARIALSNSGAWLQLSDVRVPTAGEGWTLRKSRFPRREKSRTVASWCSGCGPRAASPKWSRVGPSGLACARCACGIALTEDTVEVARASSRAQSALRLSEDHQRAPRRRPLRRGGGHPQLHRWHRSHRRQLEELRGESCETVLALGRRGLPHRCPGQPGGAPTATGSHRRLEAFGSQASRSCSRSPLSSRRERAVTGSPRVYESSLLGPVSAQPLRSTAAPRLRWTGAVITAPPRRSRCRLRRHGSRSPHLPSHHAQRG